MKWLHDAWLLGQGTKVLYRKTVWDCMERLKRSWIFHRLQIKKSTTWVLPSLYSSFHLLIRPSVHHSVRLFVPPSIFFHLFVRLSVLNWLVATFSCNKSRIKPCCKWIGHWPVLWSHGENIFLLFFLRVKHWMTWHFYPHRDDSFIRPPFHQSYTLCIWKQAQHFHFRAMSRPLSGVDDFTVFKARLSGAVKPRYNVFQGIGQNYAVYWSYLYCQHTNNYENTSRD